jgi:hypothetical protein
MLMWLSGSALCVAMKRVDTLLMRKEKAVIEIIVLDQKALSSFLSGTIGN